VGQEIHRNFMMQLATLSSTISVVESVESAIDTSSARLGININQREVSELPLNGRQVSQLFLQAPGSTNSGDGSFGAIRFSGRAVEQNAVRYDGVKGGGVIDSQPGVLNGEINTPFRLQSSLENVQEFRVESSNYPAEYGTGTGGQVSVITKSGSNSFHGSAYEYFRNDRLDAKNFFDFGSRKSELRLNQFGASLGGPIAKDKLFFYSYYEGYRVRAGINNIESIPSAAVRGLQACATGTTGGYTPGGTPGAAGNCVDSRVQPLLSTFIGPGSFLLKAEQGLPGPVSGVNGGGGFDIYQLNGLTTVGENSGGLRLDYRINNKHTLFARYFRDQGNWLYPEGVTGRTVNVIDNPQNGALSLQSNLTNTMINEAKVGFNEALSRISGSAPTDPGADLSTIAISISGNIANAGIAGQGSTTGVATPGALVRSNSASNGQAQPYTPYSLSFIDNVNWTHGNHALKFGAELRLVRMYTDRQGGVTYTFSSINNFLANSLQSTQFLGDLSAPSAFFNNSTGPAFAKQAYYIGYAQDEWKIKPNVTLSYGLRYEYYSPLKEAGNRQIYFDTTTGVLRDSSGDPYHTKKDNFGPRLALTWSPNPSGTGWFGGGKTLLRGGLGIFYGPGQTEDQIQPIESNRISSTISGGAYPQDPNVIAAAFLTNPNNRQYQPRAYAPEYTIPEKIYQYSFSVQQELPYKMVLTAGFVGSQGRNLFLRSIANRILPGQTTITDGTTLPLGVGVINRTNAGGQVIAVNTVREFSIVSGSSSVLNPFAEIDDKTSGGHDAYKALQMSLGRRFSTGLTLNSQYSFSRSFGNTSGSNEARTAANNARATSEYDYDLGYNNFDVRHTFNLSAIYDLPFGKGKKYELSEIGNAILGNWEIGTIMNARSGLPLEIGIVRLDVVIQCRNTAGCIVPTGAGGVNTTFANGFVAQLPGTINAANPLPPGFIAVVNTPSGGSSRNVRRPDFVSGVNPYLTIDRLILNPAAFATPAPGTFGNVPRNALRGPNFQQFDLIFNKRFKFSETTNLEFRTEIFNVFNRANFDIPGSRLNLALPTVALAGGVYTISSGANVVQPGQAYTQGAAGGTFGLLRQTVVRDVGLGTSRQIQFALRLNF